MIEKRESEKTIKDFENDLAKAQEKVSAILEKINLRKAETVVLCESSVYGKGCGAGLKIKDLTYIQTHWYTPPRGCTDGDYWNTGEGQFDCPACGLRNRLYNRPDIMELKRLFKDVVKEYDD